MKYFFALFSLFLMFCHQEALAQYSVEILIEKADIQGYVGDEYGPRIRLYKDQVLNQYPYALWLSDNCAKLPSIKNGVLDVNKKYYTSTPKESSSFDLWVVTHEERKKKSPDCTVEGVTDITLNKPDRYEASKLITINLNDFAPGIYSPAIIFRTDAGGTTVKTYIKIRYRPVPLIAPIGAPGGNCSDVDYTLTTANSFASSTNTTGLTYVWEYNISGDALPNPNYSRCLNTCNEDFYDCLSEGMDTGKCYRRRQSCEQECENNYPEYIDNWQSMGTTNSPVLNFNPLTSIFKGNLSNTTSVKFRVKPQGAEMEGYFSDPSSLISFLPPPPNASATFTTDPSCPGSIGTGKVYVTGITSQFSTYRYILREGVDSGQPCDPTANGCQFSGSSGAGPDQPGSGTITISGLKADTYTLFLLNNAGTEGFCPRRIGTVTVPAIKDLGIIPFTPQNLTCNGVNSGSVSVSIFDGSPSNVLYKLDNKTTGNTYLKTSNTTGASVLLDGLDPGLYEYSISDGCTPEVLGTFEITQPVKVSAIEFQKADATCTDPGNGTARLNITRSSGAFDRSLSTGEMIFQYQILKEGTPYRTFESTETTYTWNGLPVGSYQIIAKEKGGEDCNGVIQNFTIEAPTPLGISNLFTANVTCNGGNNGSLNVDGTGRTEGYTFGLLKISDRTSLSNATGRFTDLTADAYILTVKNSFACTDTYQHDTITISQPALLNAVISKKDISCYGLTDGEVTSTVTGGIPDGTNYNYTWETQLGASWVQMSVFSTALIGRSEGNYRLRIRDLNGCQTVSNEVTIVEPAQLGISNVALTDIKCFGEKGSIDVTSSGGTAPFVFAYSVDNGIIFKSLDASTKLNAAIYQIKVTDNNGCEYNQTEKYTITEPLTHLSFTEKLSDFNGFNISCFGGSNGSALITASGGNGASYVGYNYAIDTQPFQGNPDLQNMAAGNHTLNVKDARGCVASKDILFTQTSALLSINLIEKQNVVCFGDATGSFEIVGNGGLAPYRYNLNGSTFQDPGKFNGLGVDTYAITVSDRNGCTNTSDISITSINPKISIQTSVNDVSCFGGNDGSISATITGGVAPFQYKWEEGSATTSIVKGLSFGNYTVTVKDNAGCTMNSSTLVNQPAEALQMKLAIVPVCYGKTNGSITVTSRGGTSPYQYSINNGQTYQQETIFVKGAGDYTITSKDNNGCLSTGATTIVIRNDKPEPNFLVASIRNAMDTLAIVDISVPKPDSIYWIFDPNAIVVLDDPWAPQLWFQDAGTYFVSMTGYFGGCDYSVAKNLAVKPYDPSAEKEKLPGYTAIESITVTPNPSTGEFEVTVKLSKAYPITILVYDMLGVRHYDRSWKSVEEVKERIVLDNVSDGVYLLRAITESDARDVRILINK